MFGKHTAKKRSSFLPFVIFRFILSIVIFTFLLGGLYSAFQYFSGVDPMKIDPKALSEVIINSLKDPKVLGTTIANLDLQGIINGSGDQKSSNTSSALTLEPSSTNSPTAGKQVAFSFLLASDSHNENNYLQKALEQGKASGQNVQFAIHLGDMTNVGTVQELKDAKSVLDSAGLRYFVTAGDHDLWDGRDKQNDALYNYSPIFGAPYQSFVYQNAKFIIVYNADNYLGVSDSQMAWIKSELARAKSEDNANLVFVFMATPLYHPSSDHVMGKVTPALQSQAKQLTTLFKNSGVNEVFSGDVHFFTRYIEPGTNLKMTTLGAVASVKNTQAPRFAIVTVYTDGTYNVLDTEIH